jgi:glycosyltransferase involved in cell wall biosynthesis
MSWRESYPGRVWGAILKHGLAGGLQDSLARWSAQRMRVSRDIAEEYHWVLTPDRPPCLPPPGHGPLRIAWIIGSVEEAAGGQLSIFRAMYHLQRSGHQNRIYMAGRTRQTAERATAIARSYFPLKAQVELFQGSIADSDALVATLWSTAYVARGIPNTARKFYFVQDLEHLFFPSGGLSEIVKETYRWGFYGITMGEWVAGVLRQEFNMESSATGFTYDPELHTAKGRQRLPPGKKRVLFYARPATERRGFELGVLALSLVAQKMPDTEFVLLGSPLRSSQLPFPAILPGVVSKVDLPAWYRSCTAALVLSHTNVSLLPLELMASGCAVVSNKGPNVEWLLTDQIAQLADANPNALANAILTLLEDEELRARKVASAMSFAQGVDLDGEIRKFEFALYQGLKIPLAASEHRENANRSRSSS